MLSPDRNQTAGRLTFRHGFPLMEFIDLTNNGLTPCEIHPLRNSPKCGLRNAGNKIPECSLYIYVTYFLLGYYVILA